MNGTCFYVCVRVRCSNCKSNSMPLVYAALSDKEKLSVTKSTEMEGRGGNDYLTHWGREDGTGYLTHSKACQNGQVRCSILTASGQVPRQATKRQALIANDTALVAEDVGVSDICTACRQKQAGKGSSQGDRGQGDKGGKGGKKPPKDRDGSTSRKRSGKASKTEQPKGKGAANGNQSSGQTTGSSQRSTVLRQAGSLRFQSQAINNAVSNPVAYASHLPQTRIPQEALLA